MLEQAADYTAAITIALGGMAFGIRKLYGAWVKEAPDIAGNHARADVIDFLREEVQRMSMVNTELAKQVNRFQLENIQLTARLSTTTTQISELQIENAKLGAELVDLRCAIEELKKMLEDCKEHTHKGKK